jgi:ribosomal protein S18 acetylase RimI-like enzyme
MGNVVRLTPSGIPDVGEALAEAFFEDALAKFMFPDAEERKAKLPWHFAALARYGVLFGEVLTNSGTPQGAAVWLPPGSSFMTPERVAASGLDASPAVLGEEAFGRFMGVMEHLEAFHQKDVAPEHWYLAGIGVRAEARGMGLAVSWIEEVATRADQRGVPCYLETAEADNVPFYEKRGFTVVRQGTAPVGAVPYWTMRRESR